MYIISLWYHVGGVDGAAEGPREQEAGRAPQEQDHRTAVRF